MKKFFITAALVAAVASPALAASSHHARNSAATQGAQGSYASAEDTYAYARPDADTVVADGKIIGRDPDAFIRQQLLREGDHNEQNGF
jgi:uncharacterized protein YdeI (BOF family)